MNLLHKTTPELRAMLREVNCDAIKREIIARNTDRAVLWSSNNPVDYETYADFELSAVEDFVDLHGGSTEFALSDFR